MLNDMVHRRVKKLSYSSEPKRIPLKFCKKAIIPGVLVYGDKSDQVYQLSTGEFVIFKYREGIDNYNDRYIDELEEHSKNIHGISFDMLQQAWIRRIGRITDIWHIVYINKIDYDKE